MTHLARNISIFLLGATLLIFLVVGSLLTTEPGSKWLISKLLEQSPGQVKVGQISGRLTDEIILHQVESNWQEGALSIEELTLDWSLWALFHRQIKINRLTTKSMKINHIPGESQTGQPIQIVWPSLPEQIRGWQVSIDSVSLTNTQLISGKHDFSLEQLQASIGLEDGQLSLINLEMLSQAYNLGANVVINFIDPSIRAKINATSNDKLNMVAINLDLNSNAQTAILAGPLHANIKLEEQAEHRLAATLHITEKTILFSGMQIERTSLPGKIAGNLDIAFSGPLSLSTDLAITNWTLPLDEEPKVVLAGHINGSGELEDLQGQFNLSVTGPKWINGKLVGNWQNNPERLSIVVSNGNWRGSSISGSALSFWENSPHVKATLSIQDFDPALVSPDWTGNINLVSNLDLQRKNQGYFINFETAFLESTLRGVPLRGEAKGSWRENNLNLDRLALIGNGFEINAKGSVAKQLDISFDVSDLGGILPNSKGSLKGQGWVGLRDGTWLADINTDIDKLNYEKLLLDRANLSLIRKESDTQAEVVLNAGKTAYGTAQLQSIDVRLAGDKTFHSVDLSAEVEEGILKAAFEGQLDKEIWLGTVKNIMLELDQYGTWQLESPFTIQRNDQFIDIGFLQMHSSNGDLSLSARLNHSWIPEQLDINVQKFPLSLANNLVSPWDLAGVLDMEANCTEKFCQLRASGLKALRHPAKELSFEKSIVEGIWDESGLKAEVALQLSPSGQINGLLTSGTAKGGLKLFPVNWSLAMSDVELKDFYRFPRHLNISGTWQAQMQGTLQEDLSFSGKGEGTARNAIFSWLDEDSGQIDFTFNEVSTEWEWLEDFLSGKLSLVIEDHGQLTAEWQLPIPARLPIMPAKHEEISGYLDARFTEKGLTGILWPEYIQETGGGLEIDTFLEGTWDNPAIRGTAFLDYGSGYLPGPGVQLEGIKLDAFFDEQQILIENFSASSVPDGSLSGRGTVKLNGWKPGPLDIMIQGKDFMLAKLPELEITASPDLQLTGTRDNLHLTGDIHIPYFLATGREQRTPVQASPDVIVIDRATAESKELPFKLSTRVSLILGDKVLVKMFGLDARLGGQLELTGIEPQHFSGNGEIYVEDGSFSTYGVKLGIDKGRATFAGGRLDNPAIDILATRKAAGAEVGVQIRGTAKTPDVKLYSEPAMADTDILSHIVLGRPLDQAGGETDPLMLAAGALLSTGDSAVLRSKLQSQLGIDTLEAESESGETNDTILRLGKYLTPDLYLSYGYAMFGQRSEIGLRYHIYKGLEAESKFGIESGADLYYRFEFEE